MPGHREFLPFCNHCNHGAILLNPWICLLCFHSTNFPDVFGEGTGTVVSIMSVSTKVAHSPVYPNLVTWVPFYTFSFSMGIFQLV